MDASSSTKSTRMSSEISPSGWFITFPLPRENVRGRQTRGSFRRILWRSPTIGVGERHYPASAAPARDRRPARRNLSDVPAPLLSVRRPLGAPLDPFGRAVGFLLLRIAQRPASADERGRGSELQLQLSRTDAGSGRGRPSHHTRAAPVLLRGGYVRRLRVLTGP